MTRSPLVRFGDADSFYASAEAVNPTIPNLGQGGCMAIEEAVVLARTLTTEPETAKALAAFVNER